MRQLVMMTLVGAALVATAGYLLWLVLRAIYQVILDWRSGREAHGVAREAATRQQQRIEENQERLDADCGHDFHWSNGAQPRQVCQRCGMEAERPAEPCDHVWHQATGELPLSYCAKCGKELQGSWVGIVDPAPSDESPQPG